MAEEVVKKSEKTEEKKPAKAKKKGRKNIAVGVIHVYSTFNNTIITVTDPVGNVITWSNAGNRGFKGSRKGTPFAAQMAAEDAVRRAAEQHGLRSASVIVKGPGPGRESAVRALSRTGVRISSIRDLTAIPHNGCRPPKKRRV